MLPKGSLDGTAKPAEQKEEAAAPVQETAQAQPEVNTQTPNAAPEVKAEKPVEQVEVKTEVNWGEKLSEFSEGRIKSPEELKNVLSQAEEANRKLQEQEGKTPYANELVEKINGLYLSGKGESDIKQFLEVQSIDVDGIDAKDAKILRLMHENGWSKQEATEEFYEQYPVNNDDLDEDEIAKINSKLSRYSKSDRDFLRGLKVELGKSSNEKQAEQARDLEAFIRQVDESLPQVVNGVEALGQVELSADTKFDFNFDDEFKKAVPVIAKQFMVANKLKPTAETKAQVEQHIKQVYAANNYSTMVKTAYSEGYAKAQEEADAKYGNTNTRKEDLQTGKNPDGKRTTYQDLYGATKSVFA